jgi:hypothetical protein
MEGSVRYEHVDVVLVFFTAGRGVGEMIGDVLQPLMLLADRR